ncbi:MULTISPECIES: hypothetical protein [Pantoea]|uniref:Uncharacterized protein n=1 Tax=Candidatus Pantoea gossypiicola TaxID=2608008 RepID=A0AB34CRI9_9GAMM|nr:MULTISPECIES: hypothetical protein [Pantoea]KAA5961048.1 hypothetical protein F3I55_01100 [Pantoea sp. VH_24]KAA5964411.1 hypothetical protein F3I53_00930 [Pantoea sp. VH_16]KAA5968651.1 hypothetical protein F3I54_01585 [Pantoea sp. VH_18]KAA6004282.1 hypothetical protein F3I46_00245 [Pantoea sp. M_1]KAA6006766.1 hypothetical protein F3I45_00905 [Pantoea sp. F_7]
MLTDECVKMKTTICIDQIKLVAAISFELSRQYPGVTVDADQFNTIIAASNSIKSAYDGTEVEVNEEDGEL